MTDRDEIRAAMRRHNITYRQAKQVVEDIRDLEARKAAILSAKQLLNPHTPDLRAKTIPSKPKVEDKNACRGKVTDDE